MDPASDEITRLLRDLREGKSKAGDRLFEKMGRELRRIAGGLLKRERQPHTLQPTALVNEAYVRVFSGEKIGWKNRTHFAGVIARQMRQILIDHARRKRAEKRGSGAVAVTLSQAEALAVSDRQVEQLQEALRRLAEVYPTPARVVQLKYFEGLTDQEVAAQLGQSFAQTRRDWEFARAWLLRYLS